MLRPLVGILFVGVAFAQAPHSRNFSDAQKIAQAEASGPHFVTESATILDYPEKPGGEYRVLRKGSGDWVCLPGFPGTLHPESGCYDPVFWRFIQDTFAGKEPDMHSVGISYMYGGKWLANTSHRFGDGQQFHVGPHIMLIGIDQQLLRSFNADGSKGGPYVNHLGHHPELFLVIPIREWDERPDPTIIRELTR